MIIYFLKIPTKVLFSSLSLSSNRLWVHSVNLKQGLPKNNKKISGLVVISQSQFNINFNSKLLPERLRLYLIISVILPLLKHVKGTEVWHWSEGMCIRSDLILFSITGFPSKRFLTSSSTLLCALLWFSTLLDFYLPALFIKMWAI